MRRVVVVLFIACCVAMLAWSRTASLLAQQTPATPATVTSPTAAPVPKPLDRGDNAWMLISSALVLMMTAPGLAMFYGGLVRKKNVLGVIMQCVF